MRSDPSPAASHSGNGEVQLGLVVFLSGHNSFHVMRMQRRGP